MKWKADEVEMTAQQEEYKRNYPPWVPFDASRSVTQMSKHFANLITMQNGMDTDDYYMNEHHKIYRYIKDIPPGKEILFLGTGTGREVMAARMDGHVKAYGLTLGNRNTYFAYHYLGLEFSAVQEGLNEAIPFGHGSFDYVHGYQVFEHAIAPLIFLLEIGRVLRMGGEVFLEWPPGKDYSMGSNPHHQVCYTPGQAVALLEKAGFTSIQLSKDNGEPIPEDQIWRNDQNYMMCIRGIKAPNNQEYIKKAWSL